MLPTFAEASQLHGVQNDDWEEAGLPNCPLDVLKKFRPILDEQDMWDALNKNLVDQYLSLIDSISWDNTRETLFDPQQVEDTPTYDTTDRSTDGKQLLVDLSGLTSKFHTIDAEDSIFYEIMLKLQAFLTA